MPRLEQPVATAAEMEALGKRYRVIAYSQRFRYPNGPAPESADTRLAADIADLAGLIKKLKLGRAHIVGHSRGSNVAILFARKHPELVRSLILGEGPPPRSAGEDAASVAASRPSFRAEALQAYQRGDVDGALQIFSDGVLGPQHAPLPPIVGEMARSNAWQFRTLESPDQSETPFTCEDAGRLKVPVVYLQGEWSPPRARANGEQWKKCLPGSEHIVVPQSSHGLQFENPAAFNEIVLGFLARHSRLARR